MFDKWINVLVDEAWAYDLINVMTLTLGLWPMQGAWKGVGRKCNLGITFTFSGVQESVKDELTHSQMGSHFESWNLDGLSNFQRVIWGVKTH